MLEALRPYRPFIVADTAYAGSPLSSETMDSIHSSRPVLFWQSQNPFYVSLLSLTLPLVMVAAAVLSWYESPLWSSLLLIAIGILLLSLHGGLRTILTRDTLTVRFGFFGWQILNLDTHKIRKVEVHRFSPLKDFGGYGIRFNREMKAYFLNGNRGALITTVDDRKYLIGSNEPEKLAAMINEIIKG